MKRFFPTLALFACTSLFTAQVHSQGFDVAKDSEPNGLIAVVIITAATPHDEKDMTVRTYDLQDTDSYVRNIPGSPMHEPSTRSGLNRQADILHRLHDSVHCLAGSFVGQRFYVSLYDHLVGDRRTGSGGGDAGSKRMGFDHVGGQDPGAGFVPNSMWLSYDEMNGEWVVNTRRDQGLGGTSFLRENVSLYDHLVPKFLHPWLR